MPNNTKKSSEQTSSENLTVEQEEFVQNLKRDLMPEIERRLSDGERLNPVQKRISQDIGFSPDMIALLMLQNGDQSIYQLSEHTKTSMGIVRKASQEINQNNWNYYSSALSAAAAYVFEQSIRCLNADYTNLKYLEIGSCQGLSMSLVALILKQHSAPQQLLSLDPYYQDEYVEGANGIWGLDQTVTVNKQTRDRAFDLYNALGLPVELIEEPSSVGLRKLIQENMRFHLIYIDGSHEGMDPLRDLGLAFEVIEPGGIIMLDDHSWPDVRQVKELCDQHCEKICESWKIAAYRINDSN